MSILNKHIYCITNSNKTYFHLKIIIVSNCNKLAQIADFNQLDCYYYFFDKCFELMIIIIIIIQLVYVFITFIKSISTFKIFIRLMDEFQDTIPLKFPTIWLDNS